MARPLLPTSVLAGLDARLLTRLLAPHRALLEGRRLALGDDTPAWRARLGEVLSEGGADLPATLQFAFSAIGDLATPEGERELRALAAQQGIDVAGALGHNADVALWAYLEQRALFRGAHGRVCTPRAGSFAVYTAPTGLVFRSLSSAGEAALRRGWAGDGTGDSGEPLMTILDLAEELAVTFGRAAPTRASETKGRPVVVVLEKATGTLLVNAPDPERREGVRALFGRVLFGDEGAFTARSW
jgi:hypothetical protein